GTRAGDRCAHGRKWRGQDERARSRVAALAGAGPTRRQSPGDGEQRRRWRVRRCGEAWGSGPWHRHYRCCARTAAGADQRRAGFGDFAG
ncbi:MAG: DNA recombination and repair protein RecF, partial [uncultured Sphingosinicella sp.]